MSRTDDSRRAQFCLIHVVYVVTLLACGLATFGAAGMFLATVICFLWSRVFVSQSRPRTFAKVCLFILVAFGLLSVVVSQAMAYSPRSAARRMHCANNLKQIVLALHNYHDLYRSLPPAYIADSNGKPMHSWRVLILPFLEEEEPYSQYSFDEPWDGPNNRKLLSAMPKVYACPAETGHGQPTYNTSYVAVVGSETAWPGSMTRSFLEIEDGTSNTALVIEQSNSGIPWLEPRDLMYEDAVEILAAGDPEFIGNHRSERFFYDYAGGRQVALADGSVRYVSPAAGRTIWAAVLGIQDGIPLSAENLNVPAAGNRRLRIDNCIRLGLFILLALLPLPWVWLNPTSGLEPANAIADAK